VARGLCGKNSWGKVKRKKDLRIKKKGGRAYVTTKGKEEGAFSKGDSKKYRW